MAKFALFLLLGTTAAALELRGKGAPDERDKKLEPAGSCQQCMPMVNKLLDSSCYDPQCAVKAFALKQDKVMAEPDGPAKLMDIYACATQHKCDLTGAEQTAQQIGLEIPKDLPSSMSFLQMGMTSQGCPLCEAFDKCLHACASFRHEAQPSWENPASANWSPFCIQRCGKAEPGNEMPPQGFSGEYVDPAKASRSWAEKWSRLLSFSF